MQPVNDILVVFPAKGLNQTHLTNFCMIHKHRRY